MNAFKWVWILLTTTGPVFAQGQYYTHVCISLHPQRVYGRTDFLLPGLETSRALSERHRTCFSLLPSLGTLAAGHSHLGTRRTTHLGLKASRGPKRCLLFLCQALLGLCFTSPPIALTTGQNHPEFSFLQVSGLLLNAYHLPGSLGRSWVCHGE